MEAMACVQARSQELTMYTDRFSAWSAAMTTGARKASAGVVLLMSLAGAGAAGAADVYWSVGVHSPGVHVGVSNTPPVVVSTRPVVVHAPPRVVYAPPVVVYHAHPVHRAGWVPPGHAKNGKAWGHRHMHADAHGRYDGRWERDHRHGGRR
jgi:hypothetical protein